MRELSLYEMFSLILFQKLSFVIGSTRMSRTPVAYQQMEELVSGHGCPAWLRKRYARSEIMLKLQLSQENTKQEAETLPDKGGTNP